MTLPDQLAMVRRRCLHPPSLFYDQAGGQNNRLEPPPNRPAMSLSHRLTRHSTLHRDIIGDSGAPDDQKMMTGSDAISPPAITILGTTPPEL
jgi:hypothetical protein